MSKFYVFLLGFILLNATHMHAGDRQDLNLRRGNLYQNNKIASGEYHTLEIRNGTLWAWGINNKGQLGDGTTNYRQYPVQIGSDNDWISVSAIYDHSLGLKADGTLWAWGLNDRGQLGDGTNTNRTSPVQVGSADDWIHVCAGYENSIAMKSDGTLWSWGKGGSILGNGNLFDSNTPALVNTDKNWVDVSLNFFHVLATKSDGSLWAWGDNSYGKIGTVTLGGSYYTPIRIGTLNNWVSVAAGGEFSIAMKSDGTLWAWGRNTYGQLGDGTTSLRLVPQQIGTDNDWVSIRTDIYHTIAIKSDGTMWSWGKNDVGQLGDGTTTNRTSPVQIGNLTGWVIAAVGEDCSYAINKNGTLWAWGFNGFSKLGNGSINTYITSPVQVRTSPDEILMVSAGNNHSLALKTDGTLYAWGSNSGGELGNGTYTGTNYPVKVHHPNRWIKAYAGEGFSLGLSTDGTIWSWGANGNNQLGDGTNVKKNTPVQIGTDSNWIDISGGGYHALALKADGTLWGWGSNFYGMIGDGTTTTRSSPVQIGSDTDWVYISAGRTHSFAIKNNGTLWAWGENGSVGRLGDGTTTTRLSPVQIGTDTNWVQVSASHNAHSAGMKSNGTVWGWGYNADGQVGDGSTTNRLSPVQAGNDSDWTSITTGGDHTMARKSDGTLWAWGRNPYGELGDGTTTSRSTPVQMGTDNDWVNMDGGTFFTLAVHADREHVCGIGRGGMIGDSTYTDRSSFSCFEIIGVDITKQPEDTAICIGTNAGFTVTATGAHYYEWQVNSGNGWVNLSDTGIYTGSTNDTLLLTGVTGIVDSNWYRVVINSTDTSDSVQIFINTPHNIITQPTPKTICDGDSVTFSVTTTGTADSFQWYGFTGSITGNATDGTYPEGIVSGSYTNTLAIANTSSSISGYKFFVVAMGPCSTADTSDSVTITVNAAPSITTQPVNRTICEGDTTTYTMAATGTGLTYQWYYTDSLGLVMLYMIDGTYSWGTVSGATTGTMTLSNVSSTINGLYFKGEVSGTCAPPDTSNLVSLTVNTSPNITAEPTSKTICAGSNTTYSVTATGAGLTYQWQASINGGISYNNLSNSGIYSGVTTNTLALTNPTSGYDGIIYRAIVSGSCMPADTSDTASLTINTAPSIISYPSNKTICDGGSTNFSLFAIGTNVTYQWQVSTNGGGTWNNVSNGGVYSGATNTVLYITGAPASMNNYKYRAIASGTCAPSETSIEVTLTFNTIPNITANPTNKTICEGNNTSYSVTATGTGLTYQWQVHNGTSWSDVTNTGIYSGASTSTLSITAATASYNGYQYRAIVNGTCTPSDTSDIVLLTVNTAPNISSHPANSTICNGDNTTFSVAATGTALTYQWQVHNGISWSNVSNTGIYTGATTATLSLTAATTTVNNYQYRCVISGTCTPQVTSNTATLTVNTLPVVTGHPANSTICAGNNTTFSVTATGTALTYQWQVHNGSSWSNVTNTGIYSGATTATLNLTAAITDVHAFQYRCVVSGTCTPQAISNPATLTINTAPVITTQPVNRTICENTNTTFSINATGTSLTYQWQVHNGISWSNVNNTGIYSGANSNTLTLANATVAVHNYQYRCIVSGACTPSVTSDAVLLFIKTSPVITTHPTSKLICYGNNTSYSVAGTSTYTISYQWQGSVDGISWSNIVNGGIFTGANSATLNLTGAYIGTFTKYRCVLSTGCINATSNVANLAIETAPLISINPSNQVKCVGQNASFAISATGSNITYQWEVSTNGGATWGNVANGGVYSGATTNNLVLTAPPNTMNAYRYRCVVTGSCPTVKTSASATLTVNTPVAINTNTPTALTYCSGSNTSLTVGATGTGISYRWYINNGGIWTALNNGGMYSGVTNNTLNITGISAATNTMHYLYRCVATGICNTVSSNTTDITVHALPTVTSNPSNVTRCDSTYNVSFKVVATGSQLVYQWQLNTGSGWNNLVNNSLYNGVSTPNLEVANAYYSMNGYQYRCVLTGICNPTATTSVATLTVNPLLLPSATVSVSDDDICVGSSVTFTPTPTNGGTNPTYVWKRNGNPVGTGSTYTTTALANGDLVWCDMTSNTACPSPKTVKSDNTITMKVTQYSTPTITVTSDVGTSWCSGKPAVFRSNITNGGTMPAYEWQVNGQPVGANIDTYLTAQLLDGDQVRCRLTSNLKCPSPVTVTSNTLTMTINQTTRSSIVIAPNPDSVICEKTEVTMYSYYTNAGPTPSFQWMLNGADIPGETGGTMKITSLSNGDMIQCRFISSATCVFPEESLPVSFNVNQLIDPSVGVIVYYVGNETFRFTAIPVNGGVNPSYQWYKNTVPIPGATGETYDAVGFEKTDKIHVQMASSEPCVNLELLQVNSKIITTGAAELSKTFANMSLYPNPNKGQFNIKGTLNKAVTNKDVMVRITNSLGQAVFTQVYHAGGVNIDLPVQLQNDLPNGMYQVNIAIDGDVTNLRFVMNR